MLPKNITVMTNKSVKQFKQMIEHQYGVKFNEDGFFFFHEKLREISYVSRSLADIEYDKFPIQTVGLYLGEMNEDKSLFRPSIELSQMIGPFATKNVVTLSEEDFSAWVRCEDVIPQEYIKEQIMKMFGYPLVKNIAGDFFGCTRLKGERLFCFVPKSRKIKATDLANQDSGDELTTV